MKKVTNKKLFYFVAALGATFFMTMTGCKKSESSVTDPSVKNEIVQSNLTMDEYAKDLKKIKSLGFDPLSVEITSDGYRVEGDIRLTKKNLNESYLALSGQQGQYSTKYPLSVVRTINVALYDQSNTPKFSEAFDSTVVALNNLKLPLKFVRVADTAKADIITLFADLGGAQPDGSVTLGQDGSFVDSKGNPGKHVSMSSNPAAGYTTKSRAYISSVLNHEFGHAIGLRHTDYKNRIYSTAQSNGIGTDAVSQDKVVTILTKNYVESTKGKGSWDKLTAAQQKQWKDSYINSGYVNEGDGTDDSKATHIYGTPLTPLYGGNTVTDPLSIMLAVTGDKANLNYSPYDNIALFGLYGNPAQTRLIGNSLSETGTVTAPGMTLQQVVNAVKALGPNNN